MQWMAFFMPAYAIARSFCLTILFSFGISLHAHATEFSIHHADITKVGNGYVLNAQINYPLTARVKEALLNGVPITFKQELELIDALPLLGDFWQWETMLWQATIRYELRYHALAQQYVLLSLDTHEKQNFPSLQGALSALGTIQNLTLPPEHIDDTDGLILRLRSGLDLHALPTPMRPGALISDKWQLTSSWLEATWPSR